MPAQILDGKKLSNEIKEGLKAEVEALKAKGVVPTIGMLLVGDDEASALYVGLKAKAATAIGGEGKTFKLPEDVTFEEIMELIDKLNNDPSIHGILVQLPLPKHLHDKEKAILDAINPEKDVDGFHPTSIGNLVIGDDGFVGCTAFACMKLLELTGQDLKGKHAVVVGHSIEVGKPVSMLLFAKGCVVTIVHPDDPKLTEYTKQGDVLILEMAKPKFVTGDMVKPGAIVIDTGSNWVDGKQVGDADKESVEQVAGWLSPSPGGVGPMIIAMLMYNLVKAAQQQSA
ncbi:Methenyltetrahydrofolate cyclohydrolase [Thermincola ferriacetica]|uniref:Bifunctional protein FolD n=1 Tax=Thermincola ferriacetica TaxID=281456 RepID=A0A0L6W5C4_9FIRM|nr:bifunctional 5,10-methylenetetrahydrofolate dehydrogenase/5,10-methenyltetrahydrofolate cyclohydrolase [Thermincola ferriacetica]KNZ70730.1 Methenyltetrahydrofolate cyclohydrolase [Thermincola ferriacetica]